jgi:hypothetical protein
MHAGIVLGDSDSLRCTWRRHAAGHNTHKACLDVPAVQDLALGPLATSFALLRLPRMPEIKHGGRGLPGFTASDVDPDTGQSSSQQLCGPTHGLTLGWCATAA